METPEPRPIPKPRKINQYNNGEPEHHRSISPCTSDIVSNTQIPPPPSSSTSSSNDCWMPQNTSHSPQLGKPIPIPRPRKTINKVESAHTEDANITQEIHSPPSQLQISQFDDNFCENHSSCSSPSPDLDKIPDKPGLPSLTQSFSNSKGTINLFGRKIDPFDTEFESVIQGATLRPVSPPSLPQELLPLSQPNTDENSSDSSEPSTPVSSPIPLKHWPLSKPENCATSTLYEETEPDSIYAKPVHKDMNRISSLPTEKPMLNKDISLELQQESSSSNEDMYEPISAYSSCQKVLVPTPKSIIQGTTIDNHHTSIVGSVFTAEKPHLSSNLNQGDCVPTRLNRNISAENTVYMMDSQNGNNSNGSSDTSSRVQSQISNKDITFRVPESEILYQNGSIRNTDILLDHSSYYSSNSDYSCRTSSSGPSVGSHLSRDSSRRGNKVVSNEYDEVAVEDGYVAIHSPQSTQPASFSNPAYTASNLNDSVAARKSVLHEFDPLTSKSREPSPPLDLNDPCNRYEYIDADDDSPSSTSNSPQLPPRQPVISDPIEDESYEIVQPMDSHVKPEKKKYLQKRNSDSSTETSPVKKGPVGLIKQNFVRSFSHKFKLNSVKEETTDGKGKSSPEKNSNSDKQRVKLVPLEGKEFAGYLFKTTVLSKKDFVKKRAALSQGKLSFCNDKGETTYEIPLDKVVVVSVKDDHKVNASLPELKCFELGLAHWKNSSVILATGKDDLEKNSLCDTSQLNWSPEKLRAKWMQKYIETFISGFPISVTESFERGGWCFIRDGVAKEWQMGWLILKDRVLHVLTVGKSEIVELDLRKARSVCVSQKDVEHRCSQIENHEVLLIDMIQKVYYIQTESSKVTQGWQKSIYAKAVFNGEEFEQMQLTLDNVPVIVDKCIDFLYQYGTLAEGIYRQSGSNTRITQLLADFKKNGWDVQMAHPEFTAHDVAGTLKRFFRTLKEPLVTQRLYDKWIQCTKLSLEKRLKEYTKLLDALPEINYNTLKKLFCHLQAVHDLHEKNLMPLMNLAPIWGPTLMNVEDSSQSYQNACSECDVVKDLIENYYELFRVDSAEKEKEKEMQIALEKFHVNFSKQKDSNDVKIWIFLRDKDTTTNFKLPPKHTALNVICDVVTNAVEAQSERLALFEVICQENMERPLYPSENVTESIIRWIDCAADEQWNNYLIVKPNMLFKSLEPYAKEPHTISGDLKFANSKSKSFRKYHFILEKELKYKKDIKSTNELGSWKLQNIVWYLGCDPRRPTPPTKWTVTFMERSNFNKFKRCKDEPYFGNAICFGSEEELHKWLGAMVIMEHPEGLNPMIFVETNH